jgi:hypothetical protein
VLAVDACSFDRLTATGKKYSFCFYMEPIDPKFRSIPLHFEVTEDGKANADIAEIRGLIISELESYGFHAIVCATDGDTEFNIDNEETLDLYIKEALQGNFTNAFKKTLRHCS